MEGPDGGQQGSGGGQGQGRKRPLPLSSGPGARARAVLYSRIGRPLDGATRGLLASVRQGWVAGREAAAAEAAGAAAATVDQMVQVSPPASPPPPAAPASPPKAPPLPEPIAPEAAQQPAAASSDTAMRPPQQGTGRLVFLGVAPTVVNGGADKDGEEAGGGALLLLGAEVDDPTGGTSNLDWRLPSGAPPPRSVGGWQGLLALLQQLRQQEEPSRPATALALTNPLPGLQLLLDYYDAHGCRRLFSLREQKALEGVKACSWRAQAALGLLFSVGPLPQPSSRDDAAAPSDGATALWTLLTLVLGDDEDDSISVPGGIKTVAKRGAVRALRVRMSASSSRDVPALRELEARGLVALEAQSWGHERAWTIREAVKEAVGRLAFLYTGKWELVVEDEVDDDDDGAEAEAGQGQPQQPPQPPGLQWLMGLLQGTVTAAAFGAQSPLGSFTAIAATLALLGGHALGLDAAGPTNDDPTAEAAAGVGRGLVHLFQTREELERLLRARRWRCRMQRAVCGPGARARASGGSSSSSKDEGVLRLLRQVMWGLYPREQEGGTRPTVGVKDYVRSVIDAEVAARDETLAGGRSVEVSALVYSCTWQWARGILAGASWLGRKGGENHTLPARVFNLLVRMKSLLPFTAGIRRECWVSLTKLQWAAIHALKPQQQKKKDDDSDGGDNDDLHARRRRACEDLAETYDAALTDYMEEVHGGDRLAMERGRRALRSYILKAAGGNATVDTSPRSGTGPAGGEFELREGAYREVYVEAAHKRRRKGKPAPVGRRIVFEGGRNVEEVALDAYAALGYRGLFSECRLHRALLRLLLWDQILDPRVPGAFVCTLPLPTRLPLDLEHGRTFYLRREARIEARLRELEALGRAKRLGREVARAWDRHWPACASGGGGGGRWRCDGLTRRGAVELACGLAQAGLLVPILRHLVQNLSAWTRGLPDLVVWAPAGAVTGSLPAGGKAGARPDALSASTEKSVWRREHALKRMFEHRRRMQAVLAQEAAVVAAAADGDGFETPKDGGGVMGPPDMLEEDEEEEGDGDAETVGTEVDELDGEGMEEDEDEEDAGDSLAAVLLADEPLSPLQEMVESQQRALLMTQAPDVLEEDEEVGAAAAAAAGQSAGCSSYESISVTSAAPSPLPEEDPEVEVKLVEVKSRSDHLSDYQLAWITRFVKHAYPPRPSAHSGASSSSGAVGGRGIAPPCSAFELCHVRSIKRK